MILSLLKCIYSMYIAVLLSLRAIAITTVYSLVTITRTPQNATNVCRGSDVTISCGYVSDIVLPVTLIQPHN